MNYFDILFFHTDSNIYWKNKDLEYIGCNNKFLKIAGFSKKEDILGKKDIEIFKKTLTKKELKKLNDIDNSILDNKKKVITEEVGINELGEKAYYLTKKSPLYDEKGILLGIVGTSIDITAQKKLEESKAKQEELEKKSHYTKQAAGSIAHDLRTPLASIQAAMSGIEHYLPDLINGYQKAKEAGLQVRKIRKDSLKTLEEITQNCTSEVNFSNHYINLILTNLDSDEINTQNYTQHFISELIKQTVSRYPYKETEHQLIHLEVEQDFKFWGNDVYVKNMINNLLKNSLHYILEAKKGEIFISTEIGKNEDFNYLIFKDTAKGAPPEVIEHMFDGFYSKRRGGTGLGLSFCKNTMNSFGGDIKSNSKEGKYIEFILSFPKSL